VRGFSELSWAAREAAAAYAALAERYKNRGHDGPFFFGHSACTLDAVVFGHLASARTSGPCSRWARAHALPSLAPFFSAFAAAFFADDDILGAAPLRSLGGADAAAAAAGAAAGAGDAGAAAAAPAAGAAAAAAADDDVVNASLGAVSPPVCRGARGGPCRFRARERRWLDALLAMAADEAAAAAAAAAGAAPPPPPLCLLADFPLGFGEQPGAIDYVEARRQQLSASSSAWLVAGSAGGAAAAAANMAVTLGILAAATAIVLVALRPN
jgi:hypothetical protein